MSEQVNNNYFKEIFDNVEIPPDNSAPLTVREKQPITVVQIPNSIVKNKEITVNAFAVYVYLKRESFRKREDKLKLKLDHNEIKHKLGMSKDNRPLLAALQNLHRQGLIKEEILKMPIHSPLFITLIEVEPAPFTQLPIEIIEKVPTIKSRGLRLMYYYESYINRKQVLRQFAFPSFETIQEDLGFNQNTIIKYNKLLVDNKMLKVTKHKAEQGEFGFEKWNNHYFIQWDKIVS